MNRSVLNGNLFLYFGFICLYSTFDYPSVFVCLFFFCFICLTTAIIVTGPILPKPAKPLPIDLEKFMASAGDDGVIIVSFGSMMSSLPIPTIKMLAKVLGEMKQKVLWKLKGKCHVY